MTTPTPTPAPAVPLPMKRLVAALSDPSVSVAPILSLIDPGDIPAVRRELLFRLGHDALARLSQSEFVLGGDASSWGVNAWLKASHESAATRPWTVALWWDVMASWRGVLLGVPEPKRPKALGAADRQPDSPAGPDGWDGPVAPRSMPTGTALAALAQDAGVARGLVWWRDEADRWHEHRPDQPVGPAARWVVVQPIDALENTLSALVANAATCRVAWALVGRAWTNTPRPDLGGSGGLPVAAEDVRQTQRRLVRQALQRMNATTSENDSTAMPDGPDACVPWTDDAARSAQRWALLLTAAAHAHHDSSGLSVRLLFEHLKQHRVRVEEDLGADGARRLTGWLWAFVFHQVAAAAGSTQPVGRNVLDLLWRLCPSEDMARLSVRIAVGVVGAAQSYGSRQGSESALAGVLDWALGWPEQQARTAERKAQRRAERGFSEPATVPLAPAPISKTASVDPAVNDPHGFLGARGLAAGQSAVGGRGPLARAGSVPPLPTWTCVHPEVLLASWRRRAGDLVPPAVRVSDAGRAAMDALRIPPPEPDALMPRETAAQTHSRWRSAVNGRAPKILWELVRIHDASRADARWGAVLDLLCRVETTLGAFQVEDGPSLADRWTHLRAAHERHVLGAAADTGGSTGTGRGRRM